MIAMDQSSPPAARPNPYIHELTILIAALIAFFTLTFADDERSVADLIVRVMGDRDARRLAAAFIASSIGGLAFVRFSGAMSRGRAGGAAMTGAEVTRHLLGSIALATATIGMSDLAFLAGYHGLLRAADGILVMSDYMPSANLGWISLGGIAGLILALCVATSLRKGIWDQDRPKPRRVRDWLRLWWPVVLAAAMGTLLLADHGWRHYSRCRFMADYHAEEEAGAITPREVASHAWLRRWYERAAVRPWLPDHPDRIPPGLEAQQVGREPFMAP